MANFVKIHRSALNGDDPFWPAPETLHTRGEAWIDLHYLADNAGEISSGVRELAIRWAWNRNKVHRFLSELLGFHRLKRLDGGARGASAIYHLEGVTKTKPADTYLQYEGEFKPMWDKMWKSRPNNSRLAGLKAYAARREQGLDAEILKEAARRYFRYCKKRGILGTSQMLQTGTFFGPNERWAEQFQDDLPVQAREKMKRI